MMTTRSKHRRGSVMVVVIVALMVVLALGAALVRAGMMQSRQQLLEERREQAAWLAESGFERAYAGLKTSPEYRGETWKIPASELGDRAAGLVEISVAAVPEKAGRILVNSSATYPAGEDETKAPTLHARVTKTILLDLSPPSKSESAK